MGSFGVPFVAEASGLQHFRPDLRSGCHDCPTAAAVFHRSKEHVGQAKKPMISLGQKKNESMAGSHLDLDLNDLNILTKVWICACLESYDGFLSKCGILVFCKIKVWIGTMIDQAMAVHMLAGSKNEEVRSQWLANEQLRRRNVLKYLKHNKSTAQV